MNPKDSYPVSQFRVTVFFVVQNVLLRVKSLLQIYKFVMTFAADWCMINTRKEGMDMIDTILWIAIMLVMIVVEASTVSMVSIWFAGGALCAMIASLCGAGILLQLILFLLHVLVLEKKL